MKARLNDAALAIANGTSAEDVIDELLSEKLTSIYRPSNRVHIPVIDKKLNIPGGMTGIGAVVGAGYMGYKAHKRAKEARLTGKNYAKYVGRHVVRGAAGGALSGYAAQLAQRAGESARAKTRHAISKLNPASRRSKYTRKVVKSRAKQHLRIQAAKRRLRYGAGLIGIGKAAIGL